MRKLLLLLCLLIAGNAYSGVVSKPYTFSNNTTADANEVNANYDTLYSLVNGNLDTDNLSAGANIPFSKLDATTVCGLTATQTLTHKTFTTPVISSFYLDAGLTELISIPTGASDTMVLEDSMQTLTNKSLTSPTITGTISGTPIITTPVLDSFYQDAAKTKLMTTPAVASDTLAVIGAAQTFTNKTLTTPVLSSFYQDAGKTKLMTVPNTASDTLATLNATQTLYNKTIDTPTFIGTYTLTSPVVSGTPTAAGSTWTNLGTVTTADINGGTIDGTTIGASSRGAGNFTTLNASGITTLQDDVKLTDAKKFYLDGGVNNFLYSTGSMLGVYVDQTTTTDPNFHVTPSYSEIRRVSSAASGAGSLYLTHYRPSGAISQDGDYAGQIFGIFMDSDGDADASGKMIFRVDDVTAGTADGTMIFSNKVAGSYTSQAYLNSDGLEIMVPLIVQSDSPFYLDGGGDTYIKESSANTIRVVTGGTIAGYFNSSGMYFRSMGPIGVPTNTAIYLDGGSNTYIKEGSADTINLYTGGSSIAAFNSKGLSLPNVDPPTANVGTRHSFVKAWASIDDDATILDSYNISSATLAGAYQYTISWDTNFASANYAVTVTPYDPYVVCNVVPSSSTAAVTCKNLSGSMVTTQFTIMAIGDQ